MIDFQDPKQYAAFIRCLERARVGDQVEFYLHEEVEWEFYDDNHAFQLSKKNSKEFDPLRIYRITNTPTPITMKFDVVDRYRFFRGGQIRKAGYVPIVGTPYRNIKPFQPLTRFMIMDTQMASKWEDWVGTIVHEPVYIPKAIHRKSK